MPKFAANLTMLFNEHPFLERFAAAAQAGFKAVEFLFPYDFEAATIHEALQANNLTLVLHNLPAGNWAGGERGIACDPARINEFREGVAKAITYAQALNCPQLNCLAGIVPPENATTARAILVENLGFAAVALQKAGLNLLLEPVNTQDIPGFFVNRSAQALEIINEVAAPNLKLQYDIYHSQIMEGNLARTIETNLAQIGHIQLADNPGRFEPGTGEINYHYLFNKLDALGYTGWIGCEYKPKTTTADGLGWLAAHHIKL
ncbi:MAG TPA: hydroxypyruvate isomerase [Acidocella sp.]|nr:hydroxypyruvate isomerase [Acidocella sp.]HQU04413.1 hydroxypyruvate isomerase [Acidocella sp.]